ncbi:exonuclease domain-containing protein [Shewanella sp. C32]|uniref:Exonuclease domain-containing protein n=1 Tax=Shewanella electrica TaxID=515560 RepID=A0ABT2FKP3_9GAMM|nr:exonuclease domain-containing protein [Shewanella electrica]MCH1924989.1 3'-5' exonuclease [Shewanella electrica]MCS4556566.1 exonuclease domain-containing protein [Shewanella electrica]
MASRWHRWRLQYQLWRADDGLADYLSALQPLLQQSSLEHVPLVALDLEMTGLNAQHDQIISVGLIPIERGRLLLAKAQHRLVCIDGSVGQSATIHGIVDQQLQASTLTQQEMLIWLLQMTYGKLMIFHHGMLDIAFLSRLSQQVYQRPLHVPVIDTLQIEQRRLMRDRHVIEQGSLRLHACRKRYHLPLYAAHNALIDATACGELFLAQTAFSHWSKQPLDDYLFWF